MTEKTETQKILDKIAQEVGKENIVDERLDREYDRINQIREGLEDKIEQVERELKNELDTVRAQIYKLAEIMDKKKEE